MFKVDYENKNIQLQCMELLLQNCESYHSGRSDSIRIEIAENIMNSIFYTIDFYVKSLSSTEMKIQSMEVFNISMAYEKGKKLIEIECNKAKLLYDFVQKNRIENSNISYNSTIDKNGIGIFFETYNRAYKAHETPGNFDYQLCHQVMELTGIEFAKMYLENLYIENEFCHHFNEKNITNLLYGYDEEYEENIINIFEQVLLSAIGCSLTGRDIRMLSLSREDVLFLDNLLSSYDEKRLNFEIVKAVDDIIETLNIKSQKIQDYIKRSVAEIINNISFSIKNHTLEKVVIVPVEQDLGQIVEFISAPKMDDEEYRKLIEEVTSCRYLSDKLALIDEKIKSFDDFEGILLDGKFSDNEIIGLLKKLQDIEFEELKRRHPYDLETQEVNLSEEEKKLIRCMRKL